MWTIICSLDCNRFLANYLRGKDLPLKRIILIARQYGDPDFYLDVDYDHVCLNLMKIGENFGFKVWGDWFVFDKKFVSPGSAVIYAIRENISINEINFKKLGETA